MKWTTLDIITRRNLLEKGLPIHYYAEHLFHAAAALRELNFDTLAIINTVRLPVNSYYAANLPDDFVDEIAVSIPVGNLLQEIAKSNNISPLRTKDEDGNFVAYDESDGEQSVYGVNTNLYWFWGSNEFGEQTGGYFGAAANSPNGYKIFRERRQIQFTESITSDEVVLMYISDGQSLDAATMVDTRAQAVIQAYINWKKSPNADNERSPEAAAFYNQRRLLVARLDDLTLADIKNIIRKNFHGAPKN